MSNFTSIENALLIQVSGGNGSLKGKGTIQTPTVSGSGEFEYTPEGVRQYSGTLEGCKQQAADNHGGFFQGLGDTLLGRGNVLQQQYDRCEQNYGTAAPGS